MNRKERRRKHYSVQRTEVLRRTGIFWKGASIGLGNRGREAGKDVTLG